MLVTDLTTLNWQLSPLGVGEIAIDEDDIKLCIHYILFTKRGDVPMRPRFGSRLHLYIDKPINSVAPLVVAECIEALGLHEPRIKVLSVGYELSSDSSVVFSISAVVIASGQPIEYDLTYGTVGSSRAFSDGFNNQFL